MKAFKKSTVTIELSESEAINLLAFLQKLKTNVPEVSELEESLQAALKP